MWIGPQNAMAVNAGRHQVLFDTDTRTNLLPVRDRLVPVRDGSEVVPGIAAMATAGHTVGHHSAGRCDSMAGVGKLSVALTPEMAGMMPTLVASGEAAFRCVRARVTKAQARAVRA